MEGFALLTSHPQKAALDETRSCGVVVAEWCASFQVTGIVVTTAGLDWSGKHLGCFTWANNFFCSGGKEATSLRRLVLLSAGLCPSALHGASSKTRSKDSGGYGGPGASSGNKPAFHKRYLPTSMRRVRVEAVRHSGVTVWGLCFCCFVFFCRARLKAGAALWNQHLSLFS